MVRAPPVWTTTATFPGTRRLLLFEPRHLIDDKFVAVICDDTLFVKPTPGSDELFADPEMGVPYPG